MARNFSEVSMIELQLWQRKYSNPLPTRRR
nr:MAG TPA: hypothetical protein [Caudoviricetes sp.]